MYLQMTCGRYSVKIQYNNSPEKDRHSFYLKVYPEVSDTYTITPWACLPDKMSWYYKWCLFSHMYFLLVSLIFAQDTAVGVLDLTYTSSVLHQHANYTYIFQYARGCFTSV